MREVLWRSRQFQVRPLQERIVLLARMPECALADAPRRVHDRYLVRPRSCRTQRRRNIKVIRCSCFTTAASIEI